jgi:hypothetical protein
MRFSSFVLSASRRRPCREHRPSNLSDRVTKQFGKSQSGKPTSPNHIGASRRKIGHRVVDLLAEYLRHIEDGRTGREASSVLHACRASGLHGANHSIAKSSRHHCGFHFSAVMGRVSTLR